MSNDEEKEEKRGFKVEDRRRFSESGETRPEARASSPSGSGAPSTAPAGAEPASADAAEARHPEPPLIDLNFSTFVISLSTQALAHLGEIEDPIDRRVAIDLIAAKQLIDILGILKDKTKGNLDATEAGLLDSVLYDLRLRYVERARGRSDKA
jgi:hypothetical protein